MNDCIVSVNSAFVLFCVYAEALRPAVYRIKKLEKAAKAQQRAVET
jgi:hypothetical protein